MRQLFNKQVLRNFSITVLLLTGSPWLHAQEKAPEKQVLFNGRDLTGWEGDSEIWSVSDGQIVGSSVDHPIKANTFLIRKGVEVDDFRLTLKARLEGDNNSGVQYRSKRKDAKSWAVTGYQMDIHPNPPYSGMLYGEGTGRGILAERGQKVTLETDAKQNQLGKDAFPVKPVDVTQWHEYTILAQGNHLIHQLDGKLTVDVIDNHEKRDQRGILALQVHAGPPMTVYFKDLVLQPLAAPTKGKEKSAPSR